MAAQAPLELIDADTEDKIPETKFIERVINECVFPAPLTVREEPLDETNEMICYHLIVLYSEIQSLLMLALTNSS